MHEEPQEDAVEIKMEERESGDHATSISSDPDGVVYDIDQDGAVSQSNPDGVVSDIHPDGTTHDNNSDEVVYDINPDATTNDINSGGMCGIISPDESDSIWDLVEDEKPQSQMSKCDIFMYTTITLSIILFPLMTREFDALETVGLCHYDLMPLSFIFISCIGNLSFLVLMIFAEDVFKYVKAKICSIFSSCRSTDSVENTNSISNINPGEDAPVPLMKKLTVILRAMLFLLGIFLFSYRLVKDFIIIHNFEDTAWGRFQCYGFVIYNSPNFRCAMFALFAAPIQYVGRRWLDIQRQYNVWAYKLDMYVLGWNMYSGIFYIVLLIPAFWTHLWPSLVIFAWVYVFFRLVGLLSAYLCVPWMLRDSVMNTQVPARSEVMDPYSMMMRVMNDIVFAKMVALVGVLCAISAVVVYPIMFEMMARFYNGAGYGEAIRDTWGTRKISDFVDSFHDDFILALRNFI